MTTGVLLMAYGTPDRPDEVEPYFTHIRGGRTPSPEAVARLRQRYEQVGGRTPLLDIARRVRDDLEQRLNGDSANGRRYRAYVGMKHWHPFIEDVLPRIAEDGVTELVAVALAPHYSRMSIGAYREAVERATARMPSAPSVRFVESWHLHPPFLRVIADGILAALGRWSPSARSQVVTLFSAHSLPQRIREWNDPYEAQLLESCDAVARLAGLDNWRFAWQSAGDTGEPWLGPDIGSVLRRLHEGGARHVLSVPIGFVSDHLEVLYDIDHEAVQLADSLGMTLRRTPMPNADPAFVQALASLVTDNR